MKRGDEPCDNDVGKSASRDATQTAITDARYKDMEDTITNLIGAIRAARFGPHNFGLFQFLDSVVDKFELPVSPNRTKDQWQQQIMAVEWSFREEINRIREGDLQRIREEDMKRANVTPDEYDRRVDAVSREFQREMREGRVKKNH